MQQNFIINICETTLNVVIPIEVQMYSVPMHFGVGPQRIS